MKVIEILLVEDNLGDIELVREAMKEGKLNNKLEVVRDGAEAIKYMLQEDQYGDTPAPDLILMDLNLPKISGLEVLKIIKSKSHLKQIPVVILTTSQADEDIVAAYKNMANCFVSKPIGLDSFMKVFMELENFWFSVVTLP